MTRPRTGYAKVEGGSLYYEIAGEGPVLVFLHGFSFDLTMWDDEFESFSKQYQVLRYDLRGFGRSAAAEVPYSHADDLRALLDYLGISHASLVGLSLGGGAVINFALAYPGIAQALVLVAPSLAGFRWSSDFSTAQSKLRTVVQEKGIETARAFWLRLPLFRESMRNEHAAAKLKTMVGNYSGWHWTHADLGRGYKPPAIERLHEINVPTLVVIGDRDAEDQKQIGSVLIKSIPGAIELVLTDIGHLVNLESPKMFSEELARFLGQHVGR
jgi:3-oxoadipate enol-lactonase